VFSKKKGVIRKKKKVGPSEGLITEESKEEITVLAAIDFTNKVSRNVQ